MERCRYLDGTCYIQVIESFGIGAIALSIKVFSNFDHMCHMVTYALPFAGLFWISLPWPKPSACTWRNANRRQNTDTQAVLFPEETFPTLPSHECPAADACTLVDNTRQTDWTWRGQGYRRRQPAYETATPDQ